MDLNKKIALIKWLDALSEKKVSNFDDLRDFSVITDVLSGGGDIFPDGHGLDTTGRLAGIKRYMEAFYHQTLDDKKLIDCELLASNVRGDKYELEMGKLLLALLGCVIQDDKTREKFVQPALTLDEQSQYELKEMIEHTLFMNDTGTGIPPGFAEVLKRKTESSSHGDAALFFKLVADGGITDSPRVTNGTPNPSSSRSYTVPAMAMYSNSPGSPANNSAFNIRDISSPLRGMSLSSSPLSALMQSPQLAQKALMRQKEKEIKKLDMVLQGEKHLREELELDLSQRVVEITQKEYKIRELERQLGESRQMRDQIDELDTIRAERDKLSSKVLELQNRLVEQNDIRGQNQMLEQESNTMVKELAAAREELKMLSSLKKVNEEYHIQSHKHQIRVTELEASLEHQNNVVQSLRSELEESRNIKQVYQDQYNALKHEKEQLEEMFGTNHGNVLSGGLVCAGESMNIVTEKRLSELQAEYDQLRSNWIEPHEYDTVKKQLVREQEAKKSYEEHYVNTKKELLKCEEEIERLKSSVNQYEYRMKNLEESLDTSEGQCRGLEADLSTVRQEKERLLETEKHLHETKDLNETSIRELKNELSEVQTELELAQTEIELQKTASEKRRVTIVQLEEEKIQTHSSEQRLSSEIKSLRNEAAGVRDQLKVAKEDSKRKEQSLRENIASLEKVNDELDYDKHQQTNELKVLRQKAADLKLDIAEVTNRLEEEKDNGAKTVKRLESELREERSNLEQSKVSLRTVTSEYDEYKISMETKLENLDSQVNGLAREKKNIDLELQSVKFELENNKVSSDAKCQKLDTIFADRENRLKQEIVSLNSEKEDLVRGKQNLNAELVSVREVSVRQKSELQDLNSYTELLKSTIAGLNNEIDESKKVVLTHEQEIKTLNSKLKQESEQNVMSIQSLKEEIEFLNTQHKAEMKRLELKNEHQLKEMSDKHSAADQLFQENIGEWMKSMEKIKESHSDEVKALKKMIEDKECKYQVKSADYKDIEKSFWSALNSIEIDYLTMKNMLNEKKQLKEELEKVCVEKDSEISTLKNQVAGLEEKLTKDLQEAGFNVQTLMQEKSDLETQYSDLKQETGSSIAELETRLNKLQSELDEQYKNYGQLLGEKTTAEAQFFEYKEETNSNLADFESKVSELQSELLQEKENFHRINEEKTTIKTQSSQLTQENEAKIAASLSEISRLQSELDEQNNNSQELEKVCIEKDSEISSLKNQVAGLEGRLAKDLQEAGINVQTLMQEKIAMKTEFSELKQVTDSNIAELEMKLNQLQSELVEQTKNYQKIMEEKTTVETQFSEYKQDTNSNLAKFESKVADLQSELLKEKENFHQLNEEKTTIKTQSSQLTQENEAKIAASLSEISRLQSELDKQRNISQELVEEKSLIQSKLSKLNQESGSKISETELKLSQLESHLEKQRMIGQHLTDEKLSVEAQFTQFKTESESNTAETVTKLFKLQAELEQQRLNFSQLSEEKSTIEAQFSKHVEECEGITTEKDTTLNKLQSELQEQRINYQQLMCGMEEKLGGEVGDLRERLSQMKCQYETLIKSKEEDMKKISKENDSLVGQKTNVEKQFELVKNQKDEIEKQLESVVSGKNEVQKQMDCLVSGKGQLEEQLSSCQVELSECKRDLTTSQDECKRASEELSHEKGERDDLKRQLEYTQDRTDTLTAELSSQQQQLAAVEEEKHQLENQLSQLAQSNNNQLAQMQSQVDSDRQRLEIEKEELERQLQSSQKCFEAVKKGKEEQEHSLEKSKCEYSRLEERSRESERRLGVYLEKERHLLEDLQHLRDRNTELNNNLQAQLKDCSSLQESNSLLRREIENVRQHQREQDVRFEHDMRGLREDKTALEIKNAELSKVEKVLHTTEAERKKLQEINDSYKSHYNKKKEIIAQLNEKVAELNKEIDYYKRMEEKLTSEHAPLQDKLNLEIVKNKNLVGKLRTMEAQNDLAERKLREYKQQLDKGGSVFLGDPSDFQKMISARENAEDASFMENHPSSVPLDDSLFTNENETTLTPNTRSSRSRRKMSKSASTATVSSIDNADTVSIGSASSLAYRLRSRESAVSLNRSINSFDSCKTNASVPRGTGGIFHCEDEPPMDFEWGRLGELSRRNTMCPSHLKTSYPVETQRYKPEKFRDDALRESTMNSHAGIGPQPGSGRKRKQGWDTTDSGSDSADSKTSKQAKTVYQKPGPPTPRNSRRSSKGSKSPSIRRHSGRSSVSSKSPNTPLSVRGRRTPKRTPKANTPRRGTGVETRSNQGSGKKSGRRESVAFNVGFSPMSRSSRLKRQQAFIQKQPEVSTKTVLRKPLGTRNYLQTGL